MKNFKWLHMGFLIMRGPQNNYYNYYARTQFNHLPLQQAILRTD